MKMRPLRARLFSVDRQTDTTKLTIAYHNFAKTRTNKCISNIHKLKKQSCTELGQRDWYNN